MGYSAWFFNHSAPLLYHNRRGMSSAILYRKGAAQLQVMVQKTLFCIIESPRLYKIIILYNYSILFTNSQPYLNIPCSYNIVFVCILPSAPAYTNSVALL